MGSKLIVVGLFATLAVCASAGQAALDLAPFHTLSLCTPLDVRVKHSTNEGAGARAYQLVFSGKQATTDIWDAQVIDGVLKLATSAEFNTQEDLTVTVLLPASALKRIELRAAASVFVEPGFTGRSVSLVADTLVGSVSATGVQWDTVELRASGLSKLFVEGEVRDAVVELTNSASAAISGLSGTARVHLATQAKAQVLAREGGHVLGSSAGGYVVYRGGECSVLDTTGASKCVQDAQLSLTPPPAFLQCTLTLSGSQSCSAPQGTSASAASKVCQATGAASIGVPKVHTSRRKLSQANSALAAAQALLDVGSRSAQPTSYTYTSTSTGGTVTTCNFFNNVGSCQVNGSPVPNVEVISGPVPGPGPAQQDILNRVASSLAAGATTPATPTTATGGGGTTTTTSGSGNGQAVTMTSTSGTGTTVSSTSSTTSGTSSGGTSTTQSCTFVNGVGGCTTG